MEKPAELIATYDGPAGFKMMELGATVAGGEWRIDTCIQSYILNNKQRVGN
jgi:hypothetical protein